MTCGYNHTCAQLCAVDGDCEGVAADSVCMDMSDTISGWRLCSDQCDLVSATPCGSGLVCYPFKSGASVCVASGGTSVTTCTTHLHCARGYGCYGQACHRWCRTTDDCDGNGTCQPTSATVGTQAYGMCM